MARPLAVAFASPLLALALAGCAASPGGPATRAPATPAPPEPIDVPISTPATPAIPEGVTPATSDVVARALAAPDVAGSWPPVPVTVYADGSVVVPSVPRFDAPGVRRLTPVGLERLLAPASPAAAGGATGAVSAPPRNRGRAR